MKFNVDSAFWTGATHKVCQDYAIHSYRDSCAIISDGCSSSPDTDCGARFLALAAKNYIQSNDGEMDESAIIASADSMRKLSGLSRYSLDATLLTISLVQNRDCIVNIFGDGIIVYLNHDNSFIAHKREYDSGAPYYPSYHLDYARKIDYYKKFGSSITYTHYTINNNKELCSIKENPETIYSTSKWVTLDYNKYKAVLIMTDGINSFTRKVKTDTSIIHEPISTEDVLKELIAFKSFNGEFIVRRVQRFRKFCQENGWQNNDDVAIAGMYFGDKDA